jgi:hypothetical protein
VVDRKVASDTALHKLFKNDIRGSYTYLRPSRCSIVDLDRNARTGNNVAAEFHSREWVAEGFRLFDHLFDNLNDFVLDRLLDSTPRECEQGYRDKR